MANLFGHIRPKAIALTSILFAYHDLKIGLDMETTNDLRLQRNNVIDVMRNSGFFGQSRRLNVEGQNLVMICPRGRCSQSSRIPFCPCRISFSAIGFRPFLVASICLVAITLVVITNFGNLSFPIGRVPNHPVLPPVTWMSFGKLFSFERDFIFMLRIIASFPFFYFALVILVVGGNGLFYLFCISRIIVCRSPRGTFSTSRTEAVFFPAIASKRIKRFELVTAIAPLELRI